MARLTAVFDNARQAEEAVDALREMGVERDDISYIARDETHIDSERMDTDLDDDGRVDGGDAVARGAGKGALAGAGVGALFGLAAVAIPGVGPFITAGWLASTLGFTAGAAVSGAVVGVTSGAIAGALANAGYTKEESDYYGREVESGKIMVAVNTSGAVEEQEVRNVLNRHGGRAYMA